MNNFKLGVGSKIIANHIDIHESVEIGNNVQIHCDTVKIGEFSKIGNGVKINCKSFGVGNWLYMADRVEIGRGGNTSPNSNVKIGNHVGIFEGTIINPSESIEIGDDVGIGAEVMIWTHGAWLDVTQGFPSDFGPVKIGNNVWLPARCIVLPNVTIGDDSVIGIGSTINKDIPSGCLAVGSPCKVIKENCYPKELNNEELQKKVLEITNNWCKLHRDKNIKDVEIDYDVSKKTITLKQGTTEIGFTHYDVSKKEMIGVSNEISEDLRDYLRREGIKIYTDSPFKSIKQEWIQ
jgi:acetyltransferase-like isoleucine patch superfamily enzyme